MSDERAITFSLLRKFPEDFTLDRIARYLRLVGELVGPSGQVRLKGISRGSLKAKLSTTSSYYPEAITRIASSGRSEAPASLRRARQQLQEMVEEDAVDAKIVAPGGQKILFLRGYRPKAIHALGPIRQQHIVRGRVIGLEGKDETKHVRIAENARSEEAHAEVRDEGLALRLKEWLFTDVVIELTGPATFKRADDGLWTISNFRAESATPLSGQPFRGVVGELRESLKKASISREKIADIAKVRG